MEHMAAPQHRSRVPLPAARPPRRGGRAAASTPASPGTTATRSAEQRAAETGAALFDRSNRSILTVTGADRLTWLHTLTSQHLSELADGAGHRGAGAVPARVTSSTTSSSPNSAGTVYLDTEPGAGAALLGYLDGMRFWSKVEVERRVRRVRAADARRPPGAGHPRARPLPRVVPERGRAVALPDGGLRAAHRVGHRPAVPRGRARRDRVGADRRPARVPAGSWAADALRIPTRRPRWGVDTDDRTIPNEVQWLDTAVHLDKGCYRGQETVARVHNLGRPPRRLVHAEPGRVGRIAARDRRSGHHGRRPGRRPARHRRPAPRGRPDRAGPGQAHRRSRRPRCWPAASTRPSTRRRLRRRTARPRCPRSTGARSARSGGADQVASQLVDTRPASATPPN